VQPNGTTQAVERRDVMNIGGYSDQVFDVISAFAAGLLDADHWIGRIEAVAV
jgi:60 kDa SS-A/Ro ribonucleoprotein